MSDAGTSSVSELDRSYRPAEPLQLGPLFHWPWRLRAIAKWLFGFPGHFFPWPVFFIGIAVVFWLYLVPDMDTMRTFSPGWIASLFVSNLVYLVVFVSALHVALYARKTQGSAYKYNSDWLATGDPTFLFGSQLWDNVFWNVCSAVPIWTAYEVLTFWLQANGIAPTASWTTQPVYCVALIVLIPIWVHVHFYLTHRLLHWRPLYRISHYVHHKNVNFGPWSGVAMHPIEHLVYFSGVILLWIIPSHPVHYLYMLLMYASAGLGHVGFEHILFGKKASLNVGNYMHYLHHKYFNVNYGNELGFVPMDKWFGTFHDGSDEAHQKFLDRMRARAAQRLRK